MVQSQNGQSHFDRVARDEIARLWFREGQGQIAQPVAEHYFKLGSLREIVGRAAEAAGSEQVDL